MVNEQYESGYGITVRAFAFDGDEVKYRSWEGKTLALAGSKGFLLALTKESTGTALTVEEYEYGEVEVPGMAMTQFSSLVFANTFCLPTVICVHQIGSCRVAPPP